MLKFTDRSHLQDIFTELLVDHDNGLFTCHAFIETLPTADERRYATEVLECLRDERDSVIAEPADSEDYGSFAWAHVHCPRHCD